MLALKGDDSSVDFADILFDEQSYLITMSGNEPHSIQFAHGMALNSTYIHTYIHANNLLFDFTLLLMVVVA